MSGVLLARRRGILKPPAALTGASDTFTRADSNTSLGTSSGGQVWTPHTGTWGITSNKGYLVTQSGDSVATVDAGISDFDMSIDVTVQGAVGIVFRAVDDQNYLLLFVNAGQWQFYKRVAGTYTQFGVNMDVSLGTVAGTTATWRVTGSGNTITCYLAGVQKGQTTQSQFNTATRYGMRQNDGAAARYDNLVVA